MRTFCVFRELGDPVRGHSVVNRMQEFLVGRLISLYVLILLHLTIFFDRCGRNEAVLPQVTG
jgi:hypothetical protein